MDTEYTPRVEIYLLLATLFREPPKRALLEWLSDLDVEPTEQTLQQAWLEIKSAAKSADQQSCAHEFQELFIGIGRGEVVPFGSWHQTGFLMEKPLADLRQDLKSLGFTRQEQVKEPEDHIAALCEVMSFLVDDQEGLEQVQARFFMEHIAPWYQSLAEQIQDAPSAKFYQAVSKLMLAFLSIEQTKLSVHTMDDRYGKRVAVKNIQQYQ